MREGVGAMSAGAAVSLATRQAADAEEQEEALDAAACAHLVFPLPVAPPRSVSGAARAWAARQRGASVAALAPLQAAERERERQRDADKAARPPALRRGGERAAGGGSATQPTPPLAFVLPAMPLPGARRAKVGVGGAVGVPHAPGGAGAGTVGKPESNAGVRVADTAAAKREEALLRFLRAKKQKEWKKRRSQASESPAPSSSASSFASTSPSYTTSRKRPRPATSDGGTDTGTDGDTGECGESHAKLKADAHDCEDGQLPKEPEMEEDKGSAKEPEGQQQEQEQDQDQVQEPEREREKAKGADCSDRDEGGEGDAKRPRTALPTAGDGAPAPQLLEPYRMFEVDPLASRLDIQNEITKVQQELLNIQVQKQELLWLLRNITRADIERNSSR